MPLTSNVPPTFSVAVPSPPMELRLFLFRVYFSFSLTPGADNSMNDAEKTIETEWFGVPFIIKVALRLIAEDAKSVTFEWETTPVAGLMVTEPSVADGIIEPNSTSFDLEIESVGPLGLSTILAVISEVNEPESCPGNTVQLKASNRVMIPYAIFFDVTNSNLFYSIFRLVFSEVIY